MEVVNPAVDLGVIRDLIQYLALLLHLAVAAVVVLVREQIKRAEQMEAREAVGAVKTEQLFLEERETPHQ